MLAGEGTYDYKNNQGYGDNLIPPLMIHTPLGLFSSDNLLGDIIGNDGVPEIAIGRFPVATAEELSAMIEKIRIYENSSGAWKQTALMLSDNTDDPLPVASS